MAPEPEVRRPIEQYARIPARRRRPWMLAPEHEDLRLALAEDR